MAELGLRHPGVRFLFVGTDVGLSSSVPHVHLGYSPEAAASYVAHYQFLNPWWDGWRRLNPGQIGHSAAVHDEGVLERSAFYNEWLRPQEDLSSGLGTMLLRDRARHFLLAGNLRRRDRERMAPLVERTIRRFSPAMAHALRVNRMLLGHRIETALLERQLTGPGAAVALIGARRQALFLNARAEALLNRGGLIEIDMAGRLGLASGHAAEWFGAAAAGRAGITAARILPPARPGMEAMECRLVPLDDEVRARLGFGPLDGADGPLRFVLLAAAPDQGGRTERVMQVLSLSRSEAEIVLALGAGSTPREIADARGTSIHTVRNQIKAALGHAEVRRQADLLRLVDRVP